ncbi:MAG: TatD family hydrolase [Gammaproteobacteria bacterium]
MLIDSHCHFDDRSFDQDRQDAWQRARDSGVMAQIIPAVIADDWTRVKQNCQEFSGLFPAYGLHPMFCHKHSNGDLQTLREWIEREQPVAVGECGLDFYIPDPDKKRQFGLFEAQLDIASEFNLPVIIHARKAVDDVINLLRDHPSLRGVLHSYSGSLQQAERLVEMGFLMSFGGPVTYPRATRLQQVVAELPLEAIMLESDAPDQPDSQHHGQRNEPSYLPLILQQISEIRGQSPEMISNQTSINAMKLFGIVI